MKKYVLTIVCLCLGGMLRAQETEVMPEWMLQLNQAASLIKDNPKAAEEAFDELLKGKNKKNTALLVDIGEAYLSVGDVQTASKYAQQAKNVDGKCAEAYLLSGDVAMAQKDVNKASTDYNQAIFFDDDCTEAYLKYAGLYERVNPQLAIEILERLRQKEAGDSRVNKLLGDVYYGMGEYGKAIRAYDVFMDGGEPETSDYARYAMLLYLNKEYDQSLQEVEKGQAMNPDDLVLNRLCMYNHYELGEYDEGLEDASAFFAKENPDWVYLDYMYYGRLLDAKKQYPDAIRMYEKALAMDDHHADIYREMSETYERMHDYPKAIAAFKEYMEAIKEPSDVGDLFLYGRLNYYAATDSTMQEHQPTYLAEADSAFAEVVEYAPDNYLGNFWRARTNSLLDPETTQGLAKPYYEAALAILEQKPDASKALLVECLSYLGYYYFIQEDYPASKEYWNRILTIDPRNETALKALEGIK